MNNTTATHSAAPTSSSAAREDSLQALALLKKELHKRLPQVRSAHLSEALAAGFGFSTHAALLASLDNGATLDQPTSDERFAQRLAAFGYETDVSFGEAKSVADVLAMVHRLARPEPGLCRSDLDRCHAYGVVMKRKPDGSIFATHPVAGALGPHATLEAAAADAVNVWLS